MLTKILAAPFIVLLMGMGGISMLVPSIYAYATGLVHTGQVFLHGSILVLTLCAFIGIATAGYAPKSVARSQLVAILAAFSILPLMLAVPFQEAAVGVTLLEAWFEMVSSITTTGATLFDDPRYLSRRCRPPRPTR